MSESILRIHNLHTYFYLSKGILKAVDGVNLKINKGEVIGLVGESGCGKSVTALSIMRLVPIPGKIIEGKIILKNKNLLKITENEMRKIRGSEISIVFQDPMTFLNPVMRIKEQIGEVISLHQKLDKKETNEKIFEVLEAVNIPSPLKIANYYPHQLSGGMRQRVLIAIAISCNPSLLILDEPATALDVTTQAEILRLIINLKNKFESSLMLITHDMGITAEVCDKMYVMYAGQIVEYADVFTLYQKPQHPYTIGLLDSILSIDEFKENLKTIDGTVPDLMNLPSGCRFHPRCFQVKPICSKKEPPLIETEYKHGVACWL